MVVAFIVVPHGVTDTGATVWVGAVDEGDVDKRNVSLTVEPVGDDGFDPLHIDLDPGSWGLWKTSNEGDPASYPLVDRLLHRAVGRHEERIVRKLYFRRVEVGPLEAGRRYSARPLLDGREPDDSNRYLREATFTTLPESLAKVGSFTVLLGSCFYRPEDPDGLVGSTYGNLPEEHKPDVKFLCGDQVYLDNPWYETTFKWYRGNKKPGTFREMLLTKYLLTWIQHPEEGTGFRRLLGDGANFFCSDDHEFWNNAPDFGGVGLANTFTPGQRRWWFDEAEKLFRAFQSEKTVRIFDVPPLSFCLADTRIERGKGRFISPKNLRKIQEWMASLAGPGVLVLGQPLLQGGAGGSKLLPSLDKDLADYPDDYERLLDCIEAAGHSVVVLTGDVHFGRVAYVPNERSENPRLVEVISSPMCLVPGAFGRSRKNGYEPATANRLGPVFNASPFGEGHRDHFATARFSPARDGAVNMEVRYWPVPQTDGEPEPVFDFVLA